MKKLSLYVFLVLMWCSIVVAETVEFSCNVHSYDLPGITNEDEQRFKDKTIKFLVNTDEMEIHNISEDSVLSVITGIEFVANLNMGIDTTDSRTKVVKKTSAEELKNPDVFAEELLLKYKKDFLFLVDGLSRGGDIEVVLSKDYKSLKKGTRITIENVKNFSASEFFNMPIEDKFSKEKSYTESETIYFLNILKGKKKNFSKTIRDYRVYFKKGGIKGINEKKWGKVFNYYADLDLIDTESITKNIVTYYYRGHVYWGGRNRKGFVIEIFDPILNPFVKIVRPLNIFDAQIKSSARWTYQFNFNCK